MNSDSIVKSYVINRLKSLKGRSIPILDLIRDFKAENVLYCVEHGQRGKQWGRYQEPLYASHIRTVINTLLNEGDIVRVSTGSYAWIRS